MVRIVLHVYLRLTADLTADLEGRGEPSSQACQVNAMINSLSKFVQSGWPKRDENTFRYLPKAFFSLHPEERPLIMRPIIKHARAKKALKGQFV